MQFSSHILCCSLELSQNLRVWQRFGWRRRKEIAHCDGKPSCFGAHLHTSLVSVEALPIMNPVLLTFKEQDTPPVSASTDCAGIEGCLDRNWN